MDELGKNNNKMAGPLHNAKDNRYKKHHQDIAEIISMDTAMNEKESLKKKERTPTSSLPTEYNWPGDSSRKMADSL
ncbi:hypothetical protein CEXT_214471 [Caerostris extrusa]|uniref:Uncharacterized protein n=1 Tax=Caerostris extrusa TaxID=172846 RepID=A0AAV4S177_CAEEX|nr:hypothetical protein CEXT_214471 [Caerostris extrusa]